VGPDIFKFNGKVPKDSPDEDFGFSQKSFHNFNELSSHIYDVTANPLAVAHASGVDLVALLQSRLSLAEKTISGAAKVMHTPQPKAIHAHELKSAVPIAGRPSMKFIGEVGRYARSPFSRSCQIAHNVIKGSVWVLRNL
jgi:hypothetical protein